MRPGSLLMQTRGAPRGSLSSSLDRLRSYDTLLGADLGAAGKEHTSFHSLISDPDLLDDVLGRTAAAHAEGNRRVAANFVASHAVWGVTAAPLALMVLERRALGPVPATTFVRIDEEGGWGDCVFDDPPLCVIAGDPLADQPRTTVVEDVSALRAWTRSRFVALLAPFVASLESLTGLTRRWLWAQVVSAWGSAIVWTAKRAGTSRMVLSEAPAFLTGDERAFVRRPSFYAIDHRDEEIVAMRRAACCLAYKLSSAHYCVTCPLISDDERTDRFCRDAAVAETEQDET